MLGRSFKFDMGTQQFVVTDGAVKECADDTEAVQDWLRLCLRTALGKIPIYTQTDGSEDFGTSSVELLGSRSLPTSYVQSELEREIREACALNPAIDTVSDFVFSRGAGRTLQISFTVSLADEDTETEVTVEVGS